MMRMESVRRKEAGNNTFVSPQPGKKALYRRCNRNRKETTSIHIPCLHIPPILPSHFIKGVGDLPQ